MMKALNRLIICSLSLFTLPIGSVTIYADDETTYLNNTRQLTFSGKRSGEGYFSADGKHIVYQSEKQADNPFYQIYTLNLENGDSRRVSNGQGKTTCAWIHPSGKKVLFASTHHDPESLKKQKAELDFRASGKTKKYSWDYDEQYELYTANEDGSFTRLTHERGYDAECAYSPDGEWIVFASNRHAYQAPLSREERALFEKDKSSMMEIYLMKSDGTERQRLTDHLGYDGGPFFNHDGSAICWRRFSKNGATAEIFVMDLKTRKEKAITSMGVMSWAPYFHPSDDYLIFTSNKHGFGNFELFIVDRHGQQDPVRITTKDGFDGLPVFSPDGKKLLWTSNRSSNKRSQLFYADWNHKAALAALQEKNVEVPKTSSPKSHVKQTPEISQSDLRKHITFLASKELQGRMTGSPGELKATEYAKQYLDKLGFETHYDYFSFTSGAKLGQNNRMSFDGDIEIKEGKVDQDWRPLVYSKTGSFSKAPIVFAGYGIVAPKADGVEEYDSYVHLDVKDKWVMVFRYMPEKASEKQRLHWNRHISLRYKSMVARDRGAKGLIIVSGPNSKVKNQLIPLSFDASMAGTSIGVVSMSDAMADKLLASSGKKLKQLQDQYDESEAKMGFALKDLKVTFSIDVIHEKKQGRNVIAKLKTGSSTSMPVMIGAHIDHLGLGHGSDSLASGHEEDLIHYGADDNASGVAAVLEIAEWVSHQVKTQQLHLKRDLWVGLWSGEEIGLLGSNHYIQQLNQKEKKRSLAAYLNFDMIGRLDKKLILQGTGSSSKWMELIEASNVPIGLPIQTQDDSYLPTDATPFFIRGNPILSAFTGAHKDYHTPRDTVDKINFPGTQKVTQLMNLIVRKLLLAEVEIDYKVMKKPENMKRRAHLRAYLGTIPDYAGGKTKGVLLSGTSKGGPADKAGLKGGDIIIMLGSKKIDNIYDYTYAIEALKPEQKVKVKIKRKGKEILLDMITGSRE